MFVKFQVDAELPLLPFNLSIPPMGHDHVMPLRACLPLGRPTRNISGRRSSRSAFNLDLQSFLFPPSVITRAERLNPPEPTAPPEVIVLSSGEEIEADESADTDSEVQIIGSLPPLHLRPPEVSSPHDSREKYESITLKIS